ncbi:hypothetical protein QR680_003469 [Steinernema hermaphroditum]|uniref:t-SNARE coiled-coil homology domain-containing protein n=1 Tax=Steinernema hermaphroditum TaxID=289476 RepID=A0AA39H758_9BILA|nr:hypothetical protein QR680_003469 [Steinernema hermaphroditum]
MLVLGWRTSFCSSSTRFLSTTSICFDRYDPKLFTEAVVDKEQLCKPLNPDDPRKYMFIKALKSDHSPVFYRDHVVDKLIRVCMKEGKKEISRNNVMSALETVKRRQYKLWARAKTNEEKAQIELNPFAVANKAILNSRPLMKLLGVTREIMAMAATSPVALLTQFEQQYSVNTADITAKIGRLQSMGTSNRVNGIREIQRLLGDVSDLLEQMELSVHELQSGSQERTKYDTRVKSYHNDKKQLEIELQRVVQRFNYDDDRVELFSVDENCVDQQDQLIQNTESLARTSRKIQDTYRMVVETEQVGNEILGNLGSQRETITRARERMREADADVTRSNKVLSQMIRRVIQNRLLLLIIAIFMMVCLLFIIYKSL